MDWRRHRRTVVFVLSCTLILGCGGQDDPPPQPNQGSDPHDHSTAHPEHGPHGGPLMALGHEDYHAEVLLDKAQHKVTVYLLDQTATKEIAIDQPDVTFNLVLDGKPAQYKLLAVGGAGSGTSCFELVDEQLADALAGKLRDDAQLKATIKGQQYLGKFHEHDDHHGHTHGADDALVWQRESMETGGYQIWLGQHGAHVHAGESLEPAVSILRNGKSVADAKVFNSLLAGDGTTLIAQQREMVYEPATAQEPAHYAQGELAVPADAKKVTIRYRIVLPGDAGEVSYDVPATVE